MMYVDLSPVYRMVVQTGMLIILALQIYQFMSFAFIIKRWKAIMLQLVSIMINVALLIIMIGEYQYEIHNIQPPEFFLNIMKVPLWQLTVMGIVMVGITVGISLHIKNLRKNIITRNSIKEGTDDIPMGICYAYKDGMPILINHKMYTLGIEIGGNALQNVRQFWEQVIEGELPEGVLRIKDGEEPVLLLADKTAWTFSKQYVRVEGKEVVQLLAVDTTDLYQLSLEWKEKNQSLKEMNIRLQEYSENVTEVMREEEILAAKIKIHADMGSVLLATRYYLNNPQGKEQTESLIKSWNYNVSMLYNEAKVEQKEDIFVHLNAAAAAVGVTIEIRGQLPKYNVKAVRLIVAAARECLTNTVRHGDGDKVMIDIREDKKSYHVEYTNNGTAPETDIKEGGGLMGLRRRIEEVGGDMTVISNPQLVLIINIPKERR